MKICNLRTKKFYNIGPWCQCYKTFSSGWKPTNLTSVFTLRTSVFLTSWYYAEGVDTDVKYVCSRMLDGLVSSQVGKSCHGHNTIFLAWSVSGKEKSLLIMTPSVNIIKMFFFANFA